MNTEFKILNFNKNILKYIEQHMYNKYKDNNVDQIAILVNKNYTISLKDSVLAIAAIYLDNVKDINNKQTAYLGYVYSRDFNSSKELLEKLINYFYVMGFQKIIGPIEKDIWIKSGLKTSDDGFKPGEPTFDPSPNLYEKMGFQPKYEYYSYKHKNKVFQLPDTDISNIIFETIQEKPNDKEIENIYNLINLSYQKNTFFKDINYNYNDNYKNFYEKFVRFYDTYYMSILTAKCLNETIGVIIGHSRNYEQFVIKSIAIHPKFQNQQIGTFLYKQLCNFEYIKGHNEIILSMITNKDFEKSLKTKYNLQKISTYRLYELNL